MARLIAAALVVLGLVAGLHHALCKRGGWVVTDPNLEAQVQRLREDNSALAAKCRTLLGYLQVEETDTWEAAKSLGERLKGKPYYVVRREDGKYSVYVEFDNGCILGKDGWVFDSTRNCIEYYRGVLPFGEADLRLWTDEFEARSDFVASLGAKYLVAVAPIKHTVHQEYLPDSVFPLTGQTRLDQLLEALVHRQAPSMLDLRGVMLANKGTLPIYDRLGPHWNEFGQYLGYREIVGRLSAWFPAVRGKPPENFEVRRVEQGGDYGAIMGTELEGVVRQETVEVDLLFQPHARKTDCKSEGGCPGRLSALAQDSLTLAVYETEDTSLPKGILFHDSFADDLLMGLLAEHFSRLVCISQDGDYEMRFDNEIIEQERPDVVMELFVEWRLTSPDLWGFP